MAICASWAGLSSLRVLMEPRVFIPVLIVAWFLSGRLRSALKRRARERLVRNWPTITATIELPTVVTHSLGEKSAFYMAELTYFYRNPDLEMGEYKRRFNHMAQAKAWAGQFKGRTALVHVNPKDPSDSVLLESDLAGNDLVTHLPTVVDTPNWLIMPQVISPGMRALCAIAEIVGLAGLATSIVMLTVSIATHGKLNPHGFYWAAGLMFGWCGFSAASIGTYLGRTEDGRWLLKSYKQWCPGWMRWSLNLTGGITAFGPLLHLFNLFHLVQDLMHYLARQAWSRGLAPHVPYAAGCWIFFVTTAFLAAVLRSQEELRILEAHT